MHIIYYSFFISPECFVVMYETKCRGTEGL